MLVEALKCVDDYAVEICHCFSKTKRKVQSFNVRQAEATSMLSNERVMV